MSKANNSHMPLAALLRPTSLEDYIGQNHLLGPNHPLRRSIETGKLHSIEGELAIAQAIIYMAVAPKSNAAYTAFKAAQYDAKEQGSLPVPLHIRNAATQLMKNSGYGKGYRYDHDEENAFASGQTYFPEKLGEMSVFTLFDGRFFKVIDGHLPF